MVSFVLASASLTTALVPLYYVVAIVLPIVGGLWALKRYADNQRQQNIEQGAREAKLLDNLDANTKAAEKNTASIEKLGEKFDTFSSAINQRLMLVDYRVGKLEENIQNCKDNKNKGV